MYNLAEVGHKAERFITKISFHAMQHPLTWIIFLSAILFFGLWMRERIKRHMLQTTLYMAQEQAALKTSTMDELKSVFQSLSHEALSQNNRLFLDLAHSNLKGVQDTLTHQLSLKEQAVETLIAPIKDRLTHMDDTLRGLEKERVGSYEALKSQVEQLLQSQQHLNRETETLSKALRTPHIRGRWGEIQLKRLVEMSGLSRHCDFHEQVTAESRHRPDMVVSLPEGKRLVLDAKVPLLHYLEAMETGDDNKRHALLQKHAQTIRHHVNTLSTKGYWKQFTDDWVPEFVVLFLPNEAFFSAALELDPVLIEWSLERQVILATPATLIALLHAIAYGWRQEKLSDQMIELSKVGRELAKRLGDVLNHVDKVGSDLEGVVKSYNRMVGSLETRLMPGARRFKDLSGHTDSLPTLKDIENVPKHLSVVTGGVG